MFYAAKLQVGESFWIKRYAEAWKMRDIISGFIDRPIEYDEWMNLLKGETLSFPRGREVSLEIEV